MRTNQSNTIVETITSSDGDKDFSLIVEDTKFHRFKEAPKCVSNKDSVQVEDASKGSTSYSLAGCYISWNHLPDISEPAKYIDTLVSERKQYFRRDTFSPTK